MIETDRLSLRPWCEGDRNDLARMCADPNVMIDYPAPQTSAESDVRIDRYCEAFKNFGFCRWAVERRSDGKFLGYAGINPGLPGYPLAPDVDIGWRLIREAWGFGYATEAARAAIRDGFVRCKLVRIYSFTSSDNLRSQAVMRRICLERHARRDFIGNKEIQAVIALRDSLKLKIGRTVWQQHANAFSNITFFLVHHSRQV